MTDGDEVALLQQRLERVVRQIAELDQNNYDLPNASCPDPIDFTGKIQSLYDERDRLKAMIADAAGPWELESIADT
jgi:hypothetical protein